GRVYSPTLPIVADTNEFLKEILGVLTPNNNPERKSHLKMINEKYVNFSTPSLTQQEEFADLKGVINILNQELPQDAIISTDAGNFFSWISRYFRFGSKHIYIGPTSGAMGPGMPSIIGAKIAFPEKIAISFSGDGGFMMTMQEFETAVRYRIPIIHIISNNNMYGTIRAHQEKKYPNRVIATNLSNPNFAELAKNFGGHGERIHNNE